MTSSKFPLLSSAMKRAIEEGDIIALERMLKAGASPNMVEQAEAEGGKSQHSALILAISLNQIEIAELLIKAGAAIDTIFLNYDRVNKCMYEISALATTRMLYEFTLSNNLGSLLSTLEDGLKDIKDKEPVKIAPVELPKDLPNEVLVDSVREGDVDSVTILLSHGMDVNLVHTDGETGYAMSILILAIVRRRYSVASHLLERGAECDTICLNFNKSDDEIVELTALSTAEELQASAPCREIDALIYVIKDELEKTTMEPKVIVAKDIPKSKLNHHPRYRKKVPRIFIATVNEHEVEEIKAWDSGSVASFNNARGLVYRETANEHLSNSNGTTVSDKTENKSGKYDESEKDKIGEGKDSAKNSTTCVIL
ncbi:uncharacterized protein [Diadema antillarum]|uniref:uncharacterized protein n=1 Tax=Diadema antillarum TaxID=105358 RepID=UPI003A895B51